MSKTTRKNKNISSIITYQQRDVVKSLTVDGASDLMDLSDEKGHVTLNLNRDSTKLNVATFTSYKKENDERVKKVETSLNDVTFTLNDVEEQLSEFDMRYGQKIKELENRLAELEKK